jgi:hypothetical protein
MSILGDTPLVALGFVKTAQGSDTDDIYAGRTDQDEGFHDLAVLQGQITDEGEPFFQNAVELGDDDLLRVEFGIPIESMLQRALKPLKQRDLPLFVLIRSLVNDFHSGVWFVIILRPRRVSDSNNGSVKFDSGDCPAGLKSLLSSWKPIRAGERFSNNQI